MSLLLLRNGRLLSLVVLVILVSGLSSLLTLTRQEDPRLRVRFARVLTPFPGATAHRVEALVTEPLEEALREISEIKKIHSTSSSGLSILVIELLDRIVDVDTVWSKVRSKIQDARAALPPGAGPARFDDKRNAAAFGLLVGFTWEGEGEPARGVLFRLARELQARLRNVPATEFVRLYGAPIEELEVRVRPTTLASLGLSPRALAAVLSRADVKRPAGTHRGRENWARMEVSGEVDSLARLAAIPISLAPEGPGSRLGDLAEIRRAPRQPAPELAWIDGHPAVVVASRLVDGGQIDSWAARSRQEVERFARELPAPVGVRILFDQSGYTQRRIQELARSLALGLAAVFLVCTLMMGFQASLLVCSALPLTLSLVLFGLRLLGFPLHQMTVMGLIVALGLLIDNAIVVVDEIAALRARGRDAATAVGEAVEHLWNPLAGSTLTTVLAFMPIVLLEGNIGEFIGGIGVSVVLSLLASFLVSMSVVAALAGRYGGPGQGFRHHSLRERYRGFLVHCLSRPLRGIALGLILPLSGFLLFPGLPQQFFPPADRDQFVIQVWAPPDAEIERTGQLVEALSRVVRQTPGVVGDAWFAGTTGPSVYYNVLMNVDDQPGYAQAVVRARDDASARELVRRLQPVLGEHFPEARVVVRELGQGPPIDSPLEIRLYGPDMAALGALGEEVRAVLHEVPGVVASRATLLGGSPKLELRLDEDRARQAGLDPTEVADQLATRVDGIRAGSLREDLEEVPIRVRLAPEARTGIQDLATTPLTLPGGEWIPLDALGDFAFVPSLQTISRRNGERVNILRGYLRADVLPKSALHEFQRRWAERYPRGVAGIRMEFGGDEEAQGDAIANLLAHGSVLVALMFSILVLSFRSYLMAGVLGSIGVLAAGLAALVIWSFGYPWGFMASIGTAGLIGLGLNDSIVVLAALEADEEARTGEVEAMAGVVVSATRHVLTTSLTTVGGFLPLILGGGQFWPPLAAVVGTGVLGATVLALVYIPALVRVVGFDLPGDQWSSSRK